MYSQEFSFDDWHFHLSLGPFGTLNSAQVKGVVGSAPLCDIPSGYCFFTGPWTVTRSSLRMLRRVAAFCRPLRLVLLLVSLPRSRSPVVSVPGLCWMWRGVPWALPPSPHPGPRRHIAAAVWIPRTVVVLNHPNVSSSPDRWSTTRLK